MECGELRGVEQVGLPKGDFGIVLPGVVLRQCEGGRGDVHGCHFGGGEVVFESNGNAAASRAEVEDGCRSRMQRQDEALHYLLGFGTGNEGIGRHVDAETAEVRVADDVLDRAVVFEVFGGPVETQQVGLVDGVVAMQQELGFVPTKEGLEEHVDKGAQFPFGIEGAEFGEVVPLDVAHAVGGDVHVGGVHGGGCYAGGTMRFWSRRFSCCCARL